MRKEKNTRPAPPPTLAEFENRREIAERLLRSYTLEPLVDFLVLLNSAAARSDLPAIARLRSKTKNRLLRRLIAAVYESCQIGDYISAANAACGIGYAAGDMELSAGIHYFDERQAITKGHPHERRLTIPRMVRIESLLVWAFQTPDGLRRLSVEFTGKMGNRGQACRIHLWDGKRIVTSIEVADINLESEVKQ